MKDCQTSAEMSVSCHMPPIGPAIWGGCVTWRSHPATDPGTPPEAGPVNCPGGKPGTAQFLLIRVQSFGRITCVAVQDCGRVGNKSWYTMFKLKVLAQSARSGNGGRALSRYTHPYTGVLRKNPQKL